MTYQELVDGFLAVYGGTDDNIRIFDAPGRVNLIGEHIDYNGGYVFPAALTFSNAVAIRPNGSEEIRLAVSSLPDRVVADIHDLNAYKELPWGNYQLGTAFVLQQYGIPIMGCDLYYSGTVPYGSGLSSSASIEVVTALVFLGLADCILPMEQIALLCQKAENEYVGVNCGIMDQYASAAGEKGCALLLDCHALTHQTVPVHMPAHHLLMINTNKPHKLNDSQYNERRSECEQALALLQTRIPAIQNLCQLSMDDLEKQLDLFENETILRRARHVVSENERTLKAVRCLQQEDLVGFGWLMKESHLSLRDDYEVTGEELDCLFDVGQNLDGVIGIRMTGAGFGGSVVAIVEKDKIPLVESRIASQYEAQMGYPASFYSCDIGSGAHEILNWREKAHQEQGRD